ncbi:MAG TPA: HD domain-containing phosphohydrolase [Noviherbaspirillum sp.]
MSQDLTTSVNKHYLDRVLGLAEQADILATEDIFDARGMKLVAKGAKISRSLQERLQSRQLSKPFESSIAVESGVNIDVVNSEARRIADTSIPLRAIMQTASGQSPLQVLSGIQFGSAMSTMLTIIQRGGAKALEHSVTVSLISICLAKKFGMSNTDQSVVALAGLLHDIGELYIDPEYLHSGRRLLPHEWRHVVVHPHIGQMLIAGLENYPASVARAVFEHHERFNGSGYPRQILGKDMSPAGQVVSVAEMISGVLQAKDKPLQRAELALKIIPGEFPHELVSVVSAAMRAAGGATVAADGATPTGEECRRLQGMYDQVNGVLDMAQKLIEAPGTRSKKASHLLSETIRRTQVVQRAFSSAGLDACMSTNNGVMDAGSVEILFETAVATNEIAWRLRDIARDISLHGSDLDAQENEMLQPLISLLDGQH